MTTRAPTAYPLVWPDGQPRTLPTKRKQSSRFEVPLARAFKDLQDELQRFGAIGVVISTNGMLNRDGRPYSDVDPEDPGVAVYFTKGRRELVFAVDMYDHIRDNVRALGIAIKGFRDMERAGIGQLLDRAIAGFAQLGSGDAGGPTQRPWREVLNLQSLTEELCRTLPDIAVRGSIEASYKALSRTRHPDAGGSDAAMQELNLAREAALAELAAMNKAAE